MNAISKSVVDERDASLSELLDRVERGEEVTIARAGRPVACLKAALPETERVQAVLDDLWRLREEIKAEHGTVTTEEILGLIREGRKY